MTKVTMVVGKRCSWPCKEKDSFNYIYDYGLFMINIQYILIAIN